MFVKAIATRKGCKSTRLGAKEESREKRQNCLGSSSDSFLSLSQSLYCAS